MDSKKHKIVKYFFSSSDSAGDKIRVLNSADENWWEGSCKGKTGFFPASYVQVQLELTFQCYVNINELNVVVLLGTSFVCISVRMVSRETLSLPEINQSELKCVWLGADVLNLSTLSEQIEIKYMRVEIS